MTADDTILICYCSCPGVASAQTLATALVDERLAACVQCLPGACSTYRWQGQVTTAEEVLLLIKTTAGAFTALERRVQALHPYDVPELLAVPVTHAHGAYLDWLRANVRT